MPFVGIGVNIGGQGFTKVEPFTFTVDTTQSGVSASDQFKLPLVSSLPLDAEVDWGDGTSDTITTYNQAETLHTYASGGTYTIAISGDISGWKFNGSGDRLKMSQIQKWGVLNISVDNGFWGCTNMTCTATDNPTITSTTLLRYFSGCANFNGAIGNWDVNSVENMSYMLNNATSFNQDISSWDIDQVSNLFNIMNGVTLSTTNYDALLIGWEATLQSAYPNGEGYAYTISISFGGSQYTLGGAAETARTSLVNNFGWTITDGGGI